jgi:integrase/recombinase XerD
MTSDYIKPINQIEVLKAQNLTIDIQNVKQEIISHFTLDEMKILLSQLPPNFHGMIFQFLWRTGIRVSELINIRKKDLDFANNEISIRWLKNRKYKYRIIPMHSSLKNHLYMFTASLLSEDKIFPISRQRVDQLAKKYNFGHAHKIRHSFAINFLRQSDSPMAMIELKDLLGHSKIQTTMIYLKIVPENTKKAIERIRFD